jgi:transposase
MGLVLATAVTALVAAPGGFRAGRDFAAWPWRVPVRRSGDCKERLGAVSKRGGRTIRRLRILGASVVVHCMRQRGAPKADRRHRCWHASPENWPR